MEAMQFTTLPNHEDLLTERVSSREEECACLVDEGKDVQPYSFWTTTERYLLKNRLLMLRTLDDLIIAGVRHDMATSALSPALIPAIPLTAQHSLHLKTALHNNALIDGITADETCNVQLQMTTRTPPEHTRAYLLLVNKNIVISRLFQANAIHRLLLRGISLRAEEWQPIDHQKKPTGRQQGWISWEPSGAVIFAGHEESAPTRDAKQWQLIQHRARARE